MIQVQQDFLLIHLSFNIKQIKNPLSDVLFFFTYPIIKFFEGENDGLCPVNSAKWGNFNGIITGKYSRGISHADIVDIWRINFAGVDIREIYIDIVKGIKGSPSVFVVHGEEEACKTLAEDVKTKFGFPALAPKNGETYQV